MEPAAVEGVGEGSDNNFPTPVDEDISVEDAKQILRDGAGYQEFNILVRVSDVRELLESMRDQMLDRIDGDPKLAVNSGFNTIEKRLNEIEENGQKSQAEGDT